MALHVLLVVYVRIRTCKRATRSNSPRVHACGTTTTVDMMCTDSDTLVESTMYVFSPLYLFYLLSVSTSVQTRGHATSTTALRPVFIPYIEHELSSCTLSVSCEVRSVDGGDETDWRAAFGCEPADGDVRCVYECRCATPAPCTTFLATATGGRC